MEVDSLTGYDEKFGLEKCASFFLFSCVIYMRDRTQDAMHILGMWRNLFSSELHLQVDACSH